MNNALVYLGGFLIAALALLFGGPYLVDWNRYSGVFEEEVSRALGREVRIGGDVNLRLLPTPFVRLEKVRIADATGEGGSSIFRAERFTMWLAVAPLLRGVFEATRVEVKRPVIALAIDETGQGNWRSLAVDRTVASYLPRNLALNAVNVISGTVVLSAAGKGEMVRLDGIDGELSAESIAGPYKFRGGMDWDGAKRSVRIATSRQEPNGDVRFKAAVQALGSGNSYLLDGRARDLAGKPSIEGMLAAKVALTLEEAKAQAVVDTDVAKELAVPAGPATGAKANEPVLPQQAPVVAAAPAAEGAPRFDFKAKATADGAQLKLDDISVVLDRGGPPQLISGAATLSWDQELRFDLALASRWLDLDQAGGASGRVPLVAVRDFFAMLARALPAEADTSATLDFDQLNLGGEALSGVHLAARRAGGPLEITGVRATLPGNTRLALDGVLTPDGDLPRLDGKLALAGQSMVRFLTWGLRDPKVGETRTDGPFALDGKIMLGDSRVELADATVELHGIELTGGMSLGVGERLKVGLDLEGHRVNAGQVRSGLLGRAFLEGLALGARGTARDDGQSVAIAVLDPRRTDVRLKLRIGELFEGNRTLKDLDTEIKIDGGRFEMPRLKFQTPDGLDVALEATASELETSPKGRLRGVIAAPSSEAVATFLELLDLDAGDKESASRLAGLAPLRIAWNAGFGASGSDVIDVTADGEARGGRALVRLRLDGGRSAWRDKPIELTASFDGPDVTPVLESAFGTSASGGAPKAGQIGLKAVGVPASGLTTFGTATAPGIAAEYSGRATLQAGGATRLSGTLTYDGDDLRVPLAAAGIALAPGAAGIPAKATLALERADGRVTLTSEDARLGASPVRGRVTISGEGTTTKVDADLAVDRATFAGLAAPVLQAASAAPGETLANAGRPPAEPAASPPVWPSEAFDFSALGGLEARIALKAKSLMLEPGLALDNAVLVGRINNAGVEIEKLEGGALGGRLSSAMTLTKAPAGVDLKGSLGIQIGSAEGKGAGDGGEPAAEVAAFSVDFTGRALSPAALLDGVSGKGQITLGDATLSGRSPAAVSAVVEAALSGKGPAGGEALARAVRDSLAQGELKLGKITIPVQLADGALKLEKVQIDSKDGRATFETAVELATMRIDSEWQIEPRFSKAGASGDQGQLLPPVSVVYVGKLAQLAAIEPTVQTGALERELAVRKMERDVEQLERLRRQDAERAITELERQKAEQERARAEQERARAERERVARERALEAERAHKALEPPAETGAAGPPPDTAAPNPANPGELAPDGATTAAPADGTDGVSSADASDGEARRRPPPPRPATPPRRKKPPEPPVWQPFQVTPY